MEECHGIELEKYFKFNSSHFVTYEGFRENLHGHNYKVSIKLIAAQLDSNFMVTDFDNVKPVMTQICNELKHCLLIPKWNKHIKISVTDSEVNILCEDGTFFSFPKNDVKVLEIDQISAECLAQYITKQFLKIFKEKHIIINKIKKVRVKVYEDKGKCGIYSIKNI